MITEERMLEIINIDNPDELNQIQVIVKYIFDKTQNDISNIPINIPTDPINYALMVHMYSVSKQFYKNGN